MSLSGLHIIDPGPGVEVDDAGIRIIWCCGYITFKEDGTATRAKPSGCYIERKLDDYWFPIAGPFIGGPIGGYPPKAEEIFKRLCAANVGE